MEILYYTLTATYRADLAPAIQNSVTISGCMISAALLPRSRALSVPAGTRPFWLPDQWEVMYRGADVSALAPITLWHQSAGPSPYSHHIPSSRLGILQV